MTFTNDLSNLYLFPSKAVLHRTTASWLGRHLDVVRRLWSISRFSVSEGQKYDCFMPSIIFLKPLTLGLLWLFVNLMTSFYTKAFRKCTQQGNDNLWG